MHYTAGVGRAAAVLAAAVAVTALMTGCTPTGGDGAVTEPSSPVSASAPSTPSAPSATPKGPAPAEPKPAGVTSSGGIGGTKACTIGQVKVSDAHQADVRPPGTGTGAAIVSVTNTSAHPCTVQGFPTVAGAGNGSPDHNRPLATTRSGPATAVSLAPGARAWTKLTFVNVQGEADGYCASGATPATFPTLVLGVPTAGSHQIAMDDGIFAECDDKVTVTAFSSTRPS
ncbi:DUF4232 domain-containing protein [Streptomyces sp. AB3(2024)]|uniref:DUF4232 domain-containing protein n=1 Tax=Streptomyces sp. AB3(2024) TaxID=3317321 RepID=UPI0035A2742C